MVVSPATIFNDSTSLSHSSSDTRITTLCLFQLCFGYRSTLRPSGTHVTETPTDMLSATVVVSAMFLMIFLIIVLAVGSLHTVLTSLHTIPWMAARSHRHYEHQFNSFHNNAPRSRIKHSIIMFDALNSICPLTPIQNIKSIKFNSSPSSSSYSSSLSSCSSSASSFASSTCSICLDGFSDTCVIRTLPCSHHFHAVCIDRWLLQSLFDSNIVNSTSLETSIVSENDDSDIEHDSDSSSSSISTRTSATSHLDSTSTISARFISNLERHTRCPVCTNPVFTHFKKSNFQTALNNIRIVTS